MIYQEDALEMEQIHVQIPKSEHEEIGEWNTTSGKFNMKPVDGDAYEVDMVSYRPTVKPSRLVFLASYAPSRMMSSKS